MFQAEVAAARHLGAKHEVHDVGPLLHGLPDRRILDQHLLGHLGDHERPSVLVPLHVPLVCALALDATTLVLREVVVHVTDEHAPVHRLLEVQPGARLPRCAGHVHEPLVLTGHPHGQAIGVHLDQPQTGDVHQPFGQQAQQQLPVERDAHGEQRVVEHTELIVAVAVDAVQGQLQHG